MSWPSLPDKLQRAIMARLQLITTANGYQTDIDSNHVVADVRSADWMANHVPCLVVLLGAERQDEENVGTAIMTLELEVGGLTQDKDDPRDVREKLIEDVKQCLYSAHRLDDPDNPGTALGNRMRPLEFDRFDGEQQTGLAGFSASLVLEFFEETSR